MLYLKYIPFFTPLRFFELLLIYIYEFVYGFNPANVNCGLYFGKYNILSFECNNGNHISISLLYFIINIIH